MCIASPQTWMNRLISCCVNALPGVVLLAVFSVSVLADEFVIIDSSGATRKITGRLHGSGQGAYAIERPDGQIELVAQAAVVERDNTKEWQPLSPEQMAEALAEEFGAETFRSHVERNFVIGLVLMDELAKPSEPRVSAFMKKAARFMINVQNVFLKFTKELELEAREPEVPLVLLIFESDAQFEDYADEITKGRTLSARNISGFYNGLTNYLAIRMTECATFEVPLHEAIHQQVYNRGIFRRLAPIPAWFNEGLAAGFESNEDRIDSGPTKVHSRYSRQIGKARQVTWDQLITDDLAFQGDVLAGDAYCHAWALHWLLVTNHKEKYADYIKVLSRKEPLTKEDLEKRQADFAEHFGTDLRGLQSEFVLALQKAMRIQRVKPDENSRAGYLHLQKSLADLELTAVTRINSGGYLEVEGRMKDLNPFRNLTFCVTVLTDGGTFAQWIQADVPPNRIVPLPQQYANRFLQGTVPQASQTFRVHVRSVLPDSQEGRRWAAGETPAPEF